jgi:hypothetical protein
VVRLLRLGWIAAFAVGALLFPLYGLLSLTARETVFVTPFDAKQVRINRGMFKLDLPDRSDPEWKRKVMEIYGLPNEQTDVVVFVPAKRFTRPPEDRSIAFLIVDKDKGENPWQLKTFFFAAKWGTFAALAAGVAGLGAWAALRRRAAPSPAP